MIINNIHELTIQCDNLARDINRMFVSNDANEIFKLHAITKLRLDAIHDYNKRRIKGEVEENGGL